ncbi:zinc ABC transporter periplasmic protein/surface adhesin [Oleiphilus messinensis]|uniref:High-affinity zinc uptake system protein ZnuA n=1 Tax=Oleiphilus messinensis TaxID=141451 RepID=A0A1Y0IFE2_9GAMM|nr:zinc ABC transporter substrate-binding protein [Oleiphilus messinensis]ARU58093.1 zinc ABC transporter periplasmic protein/surface adhesin [Oleiphilus messinensis]
MRKKVIACGLIGLGLTFKSMADSPAVAVDIAPLHSLVSQVMDGIRSPDLLIPAEASPHQYTLRPSQARALSEARIVFWVGEGLTPWLKKVMDNIAGSAQKVEMLALTTTTTYPYREGATFERHEHHDEEAHPDDHNDHDHHGIDPHAWLDPENAKTWTIEIKNVLAEYDPQNAGIYEKNARKTIAQLDQLIESTHRTVDHLGEPKFIVFHDAYQYFEKRFNITATGSISLGDAEDPSPARITEIQNTVKTLGVNCIFTEPQYNPGLVHNVFEGTGITTIGVMDPLGAHIQPGNQHYSKLIQAMSESLSQCR